VVAINGVSLLFAEQMRNNGAREPIYRHDSVKSYEMSCVHLMRLLGLPRHYLTKFQNLRILRNSEDNSEESRLFTGGNLVLRPALNPHFFVCGVLFVYRSLSSDSIFLFCKRRVYDFQGPGNCRNCQHCFLSL